MASALNLKQSELGLIPSDWKVANIGSIGEVKMCRRVFNHETVSDGEIPFYKIGTFGKAPDAFISADLYNSYRQRFSFPRKGDILISAAGTIGRTIVYDGQPAYFQDSNIVWVDNDESIITNELLYHVFKVINYNTEGGTIQRLYNSILKAAIFALPPSRSEQNAIANALSDVDALIESLEKLIAKKRLIKQGMMQDLLSGEVRLPGFSDNWSSDLLGNLLLEFRNGFAFSASGYSDTGIPIVTLAQIGLDGSFQFSERSVSYWPSTELSSLSDFVLDRGALLIAMTDVTPGKNLIGRMTEVDVDGPLLLNQRVGWLKLNESKIQPHFLRLYSNMERWRRYCVGAASLGVQANIGTKDIRNAPVDFPSVDEQNAIIEVAKSFSAELASLEEKLAKIKAIKQGMMQQLLTGRIRLV